MSTVVISLDVELATGFHDLDQKPLNRIEGGRDACFWLVDRLEEYSIPTTWAVVGHLFLESCDGAHADHPAVDGWFESDPGGTETEAPNWYAPSVIAAVQGSRVDHEIGCHTFSHVEFGASDTTGPIARGELRRCVELANQRDLALDSFIFPRNNVAHRNALAEYGFSAYRGVTPERWYDGTKVRSVAKGVSYAVGQSPPPIVDPTVDEHGLVNVPASLNLFSFEGPAKRVVERVTDDPIVRKVRQGLRALSRRDDGVLHLWLHPNNLTDAADFRRMDRVLDLVDRYRSGETIAVRTMGEIATDVRATADIHAEVPASE